MLIFVLYLISFSNKREVKVKKNESITHIMSEDVFAVHQNQKVSEIRKLLAENSIHHVPVVDGKKLIGMLSSTDIMKVSFTAIGADQKAVDAYLDSMFQVSDIMIKNVVSINEKDSIRSAAELLADGNFHAVPIVDSEMQLKGIVSSTDLIKYLLKQY